MEFFKQTTIDFMRLQKSAAVLSVLMMLVSMLVFFHYGLTMGLDFTGGTQLQLRYPDGAKLQDIRTRLQQAGFAEAVVQAYGGTDQVMVRIGQHADLAQDKLAQTVLAALPGAEKLGVSFIGPQVGKELKTNGVLAVLVSLLLTAIYIAFRFEYRFAVSSTIALLHDPILILGVFAYQHIEFNLITLAAVLTVIGYSLNDTIVVFDRVRENFRRYRKLSPAEIINISVNQTLSRTIMTSGLTLLTVIALFVYGGPVVHGFSLALIIGIVVGTYSSIYIAGSLAVVLGLNRQDLLPTPRLVDDTP